jgi:hypothetical protein
MIYLERDKKRGRDMHGVSISVREKAIIMSHCIFIIALVIAFILILKASLNI